MGCEYYVGSHLQAKILKGISWFLQWSFMSYHFQTYQTMEGDPLDNKV